MSPREINRCGKTMCCNLDCEDCYPKPKPKPKHDDTPFTQTEMSGRAIVKSNARTRDRYITGYAQPVVWTGTVTDVTDTTISIVPLDVDRWFPLDPEITSCTLTFDRTKVTVTNIDDSPYHYT